MEALLIGIAVDILLALIWTGGKKAFLSIRDSYRRKHGIYIKQLDEMSPKKVAPAEIDKKELDDEVNKAVEKLVPTLAAKITMLGRDYSGKDKAFDQLMNRESHKVRLSKEPLPRWAAERQMVESSNPWAANESYTGFTGACGITVQDIAASTPNSNKPQTSYEKFLDDIAKVADKESDKELIKDIANNYHLAFDDKPQKIAQQYQAHLDYVKDVIKCMEEWGELPVPRAIQTMMVNAESVDDLLKGEDMYHQYVQAQFRGKKYKDYDEFRAALDSTARLNDLKAEYGEFCDRMRREKERDQQPFMMTDVLPSSGELDREIIDASWAAVPEFDCPQW